MAKADLSAQRLRELIDYDQLTGVFTRRIATGRHGCHKAGIACGTMARGRLVVNVDGRKYFASRIAWLHSYGEWPIGVIDHINGNPCDDRICNLRDVTQRENTHNERRPRRHNKSGFMGVRKSRSEKRFSACITLGRRSIYLGTFDSAEEAHQAYLSRKRHLHCGFLL